MKLTSKPRRVPVRCNKRACQARRNLTKMPEEFKRGWPKCHHSGCDGKMYVDRYRMRRGKKDHPPVCLADCYPWLHRYDSPNCRHYEDYGLERLLIGSKHCPNRAIDEEEAPF